MISEVSTVDASPLRRDLKHPTTPLRPRCKMSRKDQTADVHTSCSTPVRTQSKPASSCFSSPSDSFPYSQDNRPDVYWDYTSPKLPKGAKKKEIKITVEEFLKNLSQHQVPDCKSQSSSYIKLLEKWMTKQNTPTQPKPKSRVVKKDTKKRSRRVMDEIRQFMESIQKKKEDRCPGEENKLHGNGGTLLCANGSNHLNISMDRKSFLEGDSTENDSADDLWGDMDNSFIVKATQQLDALSKMEMLDRNADMISTIPETLMNSGTETNGYKGETGVRGKVNMNSGVLDPDFHAQVLLSQIISQDWDSASDFDEWDNGFIEEDDDALSLIPDEVLCGTDVSSSPKSNLDENVPAADSEQPVKLIKEGMVVDPTTSQRPVGCSVLENLATDKNEVPAELLDSLEDGIFSDEENSVLSRPDVLSWIDEVENKLSQSQKCSPEEIERKKEEAVQKRKKTKG